MIRWAPRRGNQMRRREFLGLLGSAAIAWPVAAQQRSAKLPRIGYLTDRVSPGEFDEAFLRGLHELGYVEGRTRTEFEPLRLLAGGWGSTPAVNMIEKENAYELTGELAGMDESNIELKVVGGVLTVKGEKKDEREEEKSGDYVLSERRFGSIQRSIPLPESVDLDRIEASFKKGVLTVIMPKTPEAQKSERKIAIKGG